MSTRYRKAGSRALPAAVIGLILWPLSHTNHRMVHAIQRNLALVLGIIACGFICVTAAPYLATSRGALGPTVLQAQSPLTALAAVIICMTLATAVACGVARLSNATVGLFVLGTGLFALDGRLETVRELAFAGGNAGARAPLALLALETLLWGGLALASAAAVFRFGGRLPDVEPDESGRHPHPILSAQAWTGAATGAAVLAVVWIIAQSPMKGQMIGATFVGATVVGLAGRLMAPHVQPILLFAAPILFGAAGHVIGLIMLKSPLDAAYVAGRLPVWNWVMPLDYAAGSLMGVAFGLGWAKSFLHHEQEQAAAAGAT